MKKIKLGMVGLGRAGKGMHLSELAGKEDMFEIYAVCDIIEERRKEVSEKYNCKAYEDIKDLIADPEVDIVDIATRSCDHYRHAKMALEAGKSVFLEKPMSCTYLQAKELVEIAEKNDQVKLYVRHNRRWEGKFTQINEIIASGLLGDVFEIRLARNAFQMRNDWQTLREFGGGQLLNWGPHIVDHALRFGGGDYKELFCTLRQINASGDCEDHVKVVIEGINGRIVDLEISSGVAVKTPEYIVYGSRGSLYDKDGKLFLRYIKPGCTPEKLPANPGTPSGHFKSDPRNIEWVEEEIEARGNNRLDDTWKAMYADFCQGETYPIALDQALKVIEMIDDAKKKAGVR